MALAQHLDNLSDHAEVPVDIRAIDRSRIEQVGAVKRTPLRNHGSDVPASEVKSFGQKITVGRNR